MVNVTTGYLAAMIQSIEPLRDVEERAYFVYGESWRGGSGCYLGIAEAKDLAPVIFERWRVTP